MMIKIDRPDLDNLAEDYFYNFFIKNGFLNKLLISYLSEEKDQRAFLRFILKRIKNIVCARPDVLEEILIELYKNFPNIMFQIKNTKITQEGRKVVNPKIRKYETTVIPTKPEVFSARLEYAFKYETFVNSKDDNQWGAYYLAKKLQVNVCPYCNRNFTHTHRPTKNSKVKGSTRPEFDHFYSQYEFPFFALSFFNLVPSCHVCNANFKSSQNFIDHLNPYENGFGDDITFTAKIKKRDDKKYIENWFSNTELLNIEFKEGENIDQTLIEKAKKNITTLQLQDLYNYHKDSVMEVIVKAEFYNSSKIDSLVTDFPRIFPTRDHVIRLITGNYTSLNDLDKRPLSKLIRDISREYGIV